MGALCLPFTTIFVPKQYSETYCCSPALGLFISLCASHQTSDPWLPGHLGLLALLPPPPTWCVWVATDCCLRCCSSPAVTVSVAPPNLLSPDFHCSRLLPARKTVPSPSFLVFSSFQSGVPMAELFRFPVHIFCFSQSPFLSRGFGYSGVREVRGEWGQVWLSSLFWPSLFPCPS